MPSSRTSTCGKPRCERDPARDPRRRAAPPHCSRSRDVATLVRHRPRLGARGRRRLVHPRARPHRSASWASRARARPCSRARSWASCPSRACVRQGSIRFEGVEIGSASPRQMRKYWGAHMAMVFQDPMTSLNPVMKVGHQITESIHTHLDVSRTFAARARVVAARVGARARPAAPHGRVPAPALRRPPPTGVHRGRAGVRPAAAAGRRAHDRARRDRAGPGARRAGGAAARAVHGAACSSPTTSASSPAAPTR